MRTVRSSAEKQKSVERGGGEWLSKKTFAEKLIKNIFFPGAQKNMCATHFSSVQRILSKARFELAPSEEERHLKPPPWTARPSRQ